MIFAVLSALFVLIHIIHDILGKETKAALKRISKHNQEVVSALIEGADLLATTEASPATEKKS